MIVKAGEWLNWSSDKKEKELEKARNKKIPNRCN